MTKATSSGRRVSWSAALVLFTALAAQGPSAAPPSSPVADAALETPAGVADDDRMAWWREARFGLFIHWGLYAIPAGEWNGRTDYGEWIRHTGQIPLDTYEQIKSRFNPARFDPDAWVRLAKDAGMKYIVITTKHHDGFALFDSTLTDWDVMSTPYGRDVIAALAAACAREGIRLGFYHSIMDWHHPDYVPRRNWEEASRPPVGADFERYVAFMKGQLKELLTQYGPIGVMWFDGQWEGTWTNERGRDLYDYVRSLQPSIIVNNRVGRTGGDFGLNKDQGLVGDFGTPEQEIPATGLPGLDWETCMTMNRNWGYNRADKDFKSDSDLIRKLVDVASKGGNFLLNVGPTADGEFPPESVDRLRAIGAWMKINGESIHGTGPSPFPSLPWGRATTRRLDNDTTRLYLHVFDYPANGTLVLPGLLNDVRRAVLLTEVHGAGAQRISVTRHGDDLHIYVADVAGRAMPADLVIALDIDGEPDVTIPPAIETDAPFFIDALDVRLSSSRRNVELRYTLDGSEPTAQSALATGPIHLTKTATVMARSFRNGRPVSATASTTFTRVEPASSTVVGPTAPGLDYVVAEGDFARVPDFDAVPITRRGTAAGLDLGVRLRESRFAVRFRGYLKVPETGVYRFFLRSDDGSRMWVDERLLIDNDGLHSSRELTAAVALAAGLHPITVAMFEQSGGFELDLQWTGPGIPRQRVPASLFEQPK